MNGTERISLAGDLLHGFVLLLVVSRREGREPARLRKRALHPRSRQISEATGLRVLSSNFIRAPHRTPLYIVIYELYLITDERQVQSKDSQCDVRTYILTYVDRPL